MGAHKLIKDSTTDGTIHQVYEMPAPVTTLLTFYKTKLPSIRLVWYSPTYEKANDYYAGGLRPAYSYKEAGELYVTDRREGQPAGESAIDIYLKP